MSDTTNTIDIPIIGTIEVVNTNDISFYIPSFSLMFLSLVWLLLFFKWISKKEYSDEKRDLLTVIALFFALAILGSSILLVIK